MYIFSSIMTPATADLGVGMLGPFLHEDVSMESDTDEEAENCDDAKNAEKVSAVMKATPVSEAPIRPNK
jgi:hypothetical protein